MFGGIKKLWEDTGITSAVDGVIREAAKGNALEVQKWYFRLKKYVHKVAQRDGISPAVAEQKALNSIDAEKRQLYQAVVDRLGEPGGILDEVNDWMAKNKIE